MRFCVTADWDNNAPHLTAEERIDLWNGIPAYQRDARTKGIPQLGAGVIYPIADDDILVDSFAVPDHWPRGYGLDVGWNQTAAEWGTVDPETSILYLFEEHYRSEASPEIHAAAILRRGAWIPGRIDPAARGRSQDEGRQLVVSYRKAIYGEDEGHASTMLGIANNAVESGIYDMLIAMQQGMFKVMRNRCPNFMAERRLYRRNEKGQIVKKFDHALDAARYLTCSGRHWLVAKPAPVVVNPYERFTSGSLVHNGLAWMG